MIISIINIFLPFNKFIASLPIIGSGYVLLFVIMLFMILFLANRLAINILDENTECIDSNYEDLIIKLDNLTVMYDIYITIGISILFFYL